MITTLVIWATASLIIQIIVLILLATAYVLKNQKKYRQHGITTTTAVILHLALIFAVMLPSLIGNFSSPGLVYTDLSVILTAIHAFLGAIDTVLGVWLVGTWHLNPDVGGCLQRKRFMLPTLTIWVVTILLGLVLYISFYATILLS
jgi:uncharacterized membrane protein YozB (DUF420 family)